MIAFQHPAFRAASGDTTAMHSDRSLDLNPSGALLRGMSRRDLVTLLGLGTAAAALPGCRALETLLERIANRRVRRDITSSAAAADLATYRQAVTLMKALPSSDPRNWARQAEIHQNHCPHGNWLFLPWHRAYLYYFEQICAELTGVPGFALPYWNWTSNPSIPAEFWGTGNSLAHARLATPSSVANPANVGQTKMDSILAESNFLQFASYDILLSDSQRKVSTYGSLEATPHNHIHGFVGKDMGTYLSPLDPIFWCHHNMIERCWVEWNLDRSNPNTNDTAWTQREFTEFVDGTGAPVTIRVLDMLLFPLFDYRYDETFASPAQPAMLHASKDLSKREAQDLRSRLSKGAFVALRLVEQRALARELRVAPGKPRVIRAEGALGFLSDLTLSAGERHVLVLDDVSLDHTEEFGARIFVNRPDATLETPIEDPGYVGDIGFFGHAHEGDIHPGGAPHDDGPRGRYVLDVTEALRRTGNDTRPVITVLSVPFAGRTPAARDISIGSVELALARQTVGR